MGMMIHRHLHRVEEPKIEETKKVEEPKVEDTKAEPVEMETKRRGRATKR